MAKVIWKGGALLAPVPPVMVSCGTLEKPNIITIGWTGILNTKPPRTYISVRPERFSYPIIRESGEFVINLTPTSLVRAADLCGVRSGREMDKFAHLGLTPLPAGQVSAPLIAQCPVNIECRVFDRIPLGSHDMFLADILAVHVDEECVSPEGKLLMEKCGLAAYAHGEYFSLGRSLGTFGFSVRKKQSAPPKTKRAAFAAKSPAPAAGDSRAPRGKKPFARGKKRPR